MVTSEKNAFLIVVAAAGFLFFCAAAAWLIDALFGLGRWTSLIAVGASILIAMGIYSYCVRQSAVSR